MPEPTQLAHAPFLLWFSKAVQATVFMWRNVGMAKWVTLPSQKSIALARRVTLPAEPTFCLSCKRFGTFCKEMFEKLARSG